MSGTIKKAGDRRILYVMAAEAEYGPHLKARFEPLFTGVGPVEAAAAIAAGLATFGSSQPDCIVCLGSAGSRILEQTGVYQASSVSYRDMDASPLGFEKGRTPFLDLPAVLPLPVIADGVPTARLSTGANIVSGAAYDLIDADMVDMETFAVLRAAHRFDVPVIGLRGISDGKAELNHIDDWTEYLHVIDEKLAQAVDRVEQAIASGAALA
ncbi:5'-methylthioadenosine/S-adenosylhomocysteine nucleosidase [Hoeflea sp.]|uniref:5'-methylthioadenosine/S-adenosylhomocysteine nucleosidase n=1 Tax=Hoeflea sp. TaxID=1940281 RepID=UPI003A9082B3